MIDRTDFTDHRMTAAQATGNRDAAYRGWDFSRAVDEPHIAFRALSECFRIRSLIIFAVMGGVLSLFWIG
jgi:hypothetical protein